MTIRPRLLLIRGLGHSGTTILDLALGAHPSIIGLGEAVRILERPQVDELDRGSTTAEVFVLNVTAHVALASNVLSGDLSSNGCQTMTTNRWSSSSSMYWRS